MFKTSVTFILILLYSLNALCANTDYYFKQIAIEQGLSQASVNSILCDHRGTLWIGTKSGLNCFNRYELKTFFHEKDEKYSLPGNFIQFVGEDSLKNIWISTNKGLVRYNADNGLFDPIVREKTHSFLTVPGGILFGGDKMLYKYDYLKKNIERIPFPDRGKAKDSSDYSILELVEFEEGKVLIGTKNKGIYLYDSREQSFKTFFSGIRNILLALCMGPDGLVYGSSYGQGVFCYNRQGQVLANYSIASSDLENNIVLDIIEKDGALWMGTDGDGIYIFHPSNRQFNKLHHIPGDVGSLPVNSITVFHKDQENNLWAGSVRGGIFGIKETFIKTYTDVALNNTNGLSEKAVISIYEEENGMVWIGTDGGGINLYNPSSRQFTHFANTYGDKVVSITGLSENELLVSLYSKGMFTFNKKTGKYTTFTIVNSSINIQESFYGFIPQGYKVAENKIYLLSYSPRIYHPREKTFTEVKLEEGVSPEAFQMAYSNDSISYFMKENQVFEVEQVNDSLHTLFSINEGDNIHAVCYDGENILWVGTDQGLGYYDLGRKSYNRIPTKLFNSVSNLLLDNKGRLWICAQNMLFSYIIKENKFVVWSESDGFSPNEILFMYQKTLDNGYIYLGGTEGFVKINQDISLNDMQKPEVELTNVIFNGRSCMNRLANHSVDIPWDYTSLEVAVGVSGKDIFRKILFRYTIVGMGQQEMESYNPHLPLPSLLPGTYSIFVSCNTKNGSYTDPVKILEITITPPWYKSGWFLVGCILLLIGLAGGISYFIFWKKNTRLRWEMKEYEQSINEEKINFLVNISHELRTPLTLIYAPLKRLIDKEKVEFNPAFVTGQLHAIYKQARQMKNIINMVLDLNRLNGEQEILKRQPHPLNEWIKTIAADFSNEWQEKNFEVEFRLDVQVGQIWFDEWKCQIVLSNLLMNALKFSPANSHLCISTVLQGETVRVAVSDEGIGLQNVDISQLFNRFYQGYHNKTGSGIGLSYAKILIQMHGGSIGAYNNPEKGATFYFELPTAMQDNLPVTITATDYAIPEVQEFPVQTSCSSYSLLIVEDEVELRSFLQETLKESFKCVYAAADGEEAFDICHSRQPDLVVSDVMMPRMDGYELCKRIKNDLEISHIPVVLLTARCDQASRIFGYKQGADFYLSKPFETEFLLTICGNLLRSREMVRRNYKEGAEEVLPQEVTISKSDEEFLIKLNGLIHENLSSPELSIKFLTDSMAMSRASLYNKVRALTGLGVNDYINRLRIERAVHLLTQTEMNINEISNEVGFTYPRYFSTMFKQVKGVTPTQFKESIGGK